MKSFLPILFLMFFAAGFSQEPPRKIKDQFTKDALNQKIVSIDGKKQTIGNILKNYKGKVLVVDFWASWCRDCVLALPKTEVLKANHPKVEFVYFSLDRSEDQWKKGLEKYGIANQKNYWFDEGWKNKFNDYIELNWVPRFIVVDQTGKIADYYAISPEDAELVETLTRLSKQ